MTLENTNSEKTVLIRMYAQTDVGMVRQGNEDNFLVVDLSTAATWTADHDAPPTELLSYTQGRYGSLFAVSDGMGGALAGEVASQLAVTAVRDWMLQFQANPKFQPFPFHERLRLSVEQANLLINSKSQSHAEYAGMGATFTAAGVDHTTLYLAQIGDSRAYLIRNGRIAQMTKDQSLVSQLVEAGHITEEEAESHHYKNVILQALGATASVIVVVDCVQLQRDDILLLCSDGLSGKVRGPEMLQIFNACNGDLTEGCRKLIQTANERGGEDNITVMLMHFSGEGLDAPTDSNNFESRVIQRDPRLPDEIDESLLIYEKDTLDAQNKATGPLTVPTTTAVLSAAVVAELYEVAAASGQPSVAPPPPAPSPPMPALPTPVRQSQNNSKLIAASLFMLALIVVAFLLYRKNTAPTAAESPPPQPKPTPTAPAQPSSTPPASQPSTPPPAPPASEPAKENK